MNGGTCSGGTCSCPTGYIGSNCGTLATTSISYTNTTFTPIQITSNGVTSTIAVGGSVTYTGQFGTTNSYTAYTYGTTNTGTQIGGKITWSDSHTFPSSGTTTIPLNVEATIFFLKVKNSNASHSASGVYVNYNTTSQSFDNISIPNDGNTYGVGYYPAFTNTEIYILANPSSAGYWAQYPIFNFVPNQYYIMDMN